MVEYVVLLVILLNAYRNIGCALVAIGIFYSGSTVVVVVVVEEVD